jgi:hypothetical protein
MEGANDTHVTAQTKTSCTLIVSSQRCSIRSFDVNALRTPYTSERYSRPGVLTRKAENGNSKARKRFVRAAEIARVDAAKDIAETLHLAFRGVPCYDFLKLFESGC